MTVIGVREVGVRPDGSFDVQVSFDRTAEYQVTVTDPATAGSEDELVWYFEEHLRYPFLDQDRRQLAVQHIREYGQALFAQLFGGPVTRRLLRWGRRGWTSRPRVGCSSLGCRSSW